MIMRYVCNSVPEDDRSARLGSLLISCFVVLSEVRAFSSQPAAEGTKREAL